MTQGDKTVTETRSYRPHSSALRRYVLREDLVIPAGTVFDAGPIRIEYADQPLEHVIGLGADHCLMLMFPRPATDDELSEWFDVHE